MTERKLKAKWTVDAEMDMINMHSKNVAYSVCIDEDVKTGDIVEHYLCRHGSKQPTSTNVQLTHTEIRVGVCIETEMFDDKTRKVVCMIPEENRYVHFFHSEPRSNLDVFYWPHLRKAT